MSEQQLRLVISSVNQSATAFRALSASLGSLMRDVRQFNQAARNGFVATTATLRSLVTAFGAAASAAAAAGRTITGMARSALGALQPLTFAATAAGAAIGGGLTAGIVGVARAGVGMNIALQGAQAGLTAILGSSRAATQFIAALRETARETAPTFEELLPIGQALAAVYGPAGLGQAIRTIKAFDAAGKVLAGGDRFATSRALLQFRQLASSATPQGDELKLIEENLPGAGIRDIVKRAFGTSDSEELKEAGVTGRMIADAIIFGLEQRFGAATGLMRDSIPLLFSGIQDTFNDIAARLSTLLTGSIGKALASIKGTLDSVLGNEQLMRGLALPFDLAAKAAEKLVTYLPGIIQWFGQLGNSDTLKTLVAALQALFQTIGGRLAKGLGLEGLFDVKNINRMLEALWKGITRTIDMAFGLGRVFGEIRKIITGAIQDAGDRIGDVIADLKIAFGRFFANVSLGVERLTGNILQSFIGMVQGINGVLAHLRLPQINTSGMQGALQKSLIRQGQGILDMAGFDQAERNESDRRARRERAKDLADQFRHDDPFTRVAAAWRGRGGPDQDSQRAFWADFEKNFAGVFQGLFGAAATGPMPPALGAGVGSLGARNLTLPVPRPGLPFVGAPLAGAGMAGTAGFLTPGAAQEAARGLAHWNWQQAQYPAVTGANRSREVIGYPSVAAPQAPPALVPYTGTRNLSRGGPPANIEIDVNMQGPGEEWIERAVQRFREELYQQASRNTGLGRR